MIIRNDNIVEATINDLPDYQLLYDDAFGLTKVNLVAWFRGDAGVTLSGSDVRSWTSQYGTPIISATTSGTDWEMGNNLNSYPSLRQPADAFATLDFTTVPSISASYTIFVVLRSPEVYAEYVMKSSAGGFIGFNLRPDFNDGKGGPFLNGASLVAGTGGQNPTTPQYIMYQSGPQGSVIRQNGVQILTNGTGIYDSPSAIWGRKGLEVWEVLIYGDVKSNTEAINIENYIKSKYGF